MAFTHILVPFDGSNPSNIALDKAIWLATQSSAKLTVVHVISFQPMVAANIPYFPLQQFEEQLQEQANSLLDSIKEKLTGLPSVDVISLIGSPASTIVGYADSESCDLIVMGSRGLSAIKEFMLGSVSHNVVQHAKIPVLIVK